MKNRFVWFCFYLSILLFWGCAAHTNLHPVGKGNKTAHFSIGGPIVKAFGTSIPVPYATVGLDKGLTRTMDINSHLHLLSLVYQVAGLDIGATWFPVLNDGLVPTLGFQPGLLVYSSLKSDVESRFRIYPTFSGSAAWRVGSGLVYSGFDMVAPFSDMDYDENASNIIFSPFLGYKWKLGTRYFLYTELKWNGANIESHQLAPDYLPISNYGAVSTLFSIERSF